MVHCVIQKRYFFVRNLTLASKSFSVNNIFIHIGFIFLIIKATYLVIDFILTMLEIRPKVCQYDELYKIKHCDKYETIRISINLVYFLLFIRKLIIVHYLYAWQDKNLRNPNHDLLVGVQIYELFLMSDRQRKGQSEREKKKKGRERKKGRKTIDIYTCT